MKHKFIHEINISRKLAIEALNISWVADIQYVSVCVAPDILTDLWQIPVWLIGSYKVRKGEHDLVCPSVGKKAYSVIKSKPPDHPQHVTKGIKTVTCKPPAPWLLPIFSLHRHVGFSGN